MMLRYLRIRTGLWRTVCRTYIRLWNHSVSLSLQQRGHKLHYMYIGNFLKYDLAAIFGFLTLPVIGDALQLIPEYDLPRGIVHNGQTGKSIRRQDIAGGSLDPCPGAVQLIYNSALDTLPAGQNGQPFHFAFFQQLIIDGQVVPVRYPVQVTADNVQVPGLIIPL